jgi:hypothetical protein
VGKSVDLKNLLRIHQQQNSRENARLLILSGAANVADENPYY